MRLKEIYKEVLVEGRTNELTLSEAKNYLEDIKSNWSPWNTPIFRGHSNFDGNYGIVRPHQAQRRRKSAHTENYYTLMIDNLPEWEKFPDRSMSIICSTNPHLAGGYGNLYFVIPLESGKVGVAPDEDIWASFDMSVTNLNKYLNKLSKRAFGEEGLPEDSFSKFKKKVLEMDRLLKEGEGHFKGYDYEKIVQMSGHHGYKEFIKDYLYSHFDDLFSFVRAILDPDSNGFSLQKYDKDFRIGGSYVNREVWTSLPSIMVKYNDENLNKLFDTDVDWMNFHGFDLEE